MTLVYVGLLVLAMNVSRLVRSVIFIMYVVYMHSSRSCCWHIIEFDE